MPHHAGRLAAQPAPHPLRVATHNVGGLPGVHSPRLHALARVWAEQKLDIVCLQETHHTRLEHVNAMVRVLSEAGGRLHVAGWQVVAHSLSSSSRTAGVAILVRRDLLARIQAVATPARLAPAALPAPLAGRLAAYSFKWGGHTLHLLNVYLPTGTLHSVRADFVSQYLAPLSSAAGVADSLVWAGDFNFVADSGRDSSAGPEGRAGDRPVARVFADACPGLVDSHRALHPHRRDYTHLYRAPHAGGSRLDRIYVARSLLPYVVQTTVASHSPTDHRLATLLLLPCTVIARGPGLRRVRTHFLAHEDLLGSMETWLDVEIAHKPAPTAPEELLAWWPLFKARMTVTAASLNRAARCRRLTPGPRTQVARTAARAAQLAAMAAPSQAAALPALVAAQAAVMRAEHDDATDAARSCRVRWLRGGERPSPAVTAVVHPPRAVSSVPALRDPGGRLVTAPEQLPRLVADYWSAICRAPAVSPVARDAVLAAVRERAQPMTADWADAVGHPQITAAEVAKALKATPSGKSPGWDGVPADLYRALRDRLAPVLADVFTAIGTSGRLPVGFLDGVITVLYKNRGDRTQAGSYRPITLLCTDYRLLTKVLATRLGPALATVVGLEQSAFLPGRLIGANILFLRHLPHLMAQQGRSCLVAFLDFAKAYDTLDRDFLFAVMDALGAGPGLLAWSRLLLSNTQSCALVNGHRSPLVPFAAGVRQGCPLAPLLYLFAAQALLSWLQHCEVGLRLAPDAAPITAVQFADDTEVVLDGPAAVPHFVQCMDTFALASGQRLNMDKVELLPLGVPPPFGPAVGVAGAPPPPPEAPGAGGPTLAPIAGLRVVSSALALNLPFTDAPLTPSLNWDEQAVVVRARLQKIAHLGFSAFGRATASAAYGLHRLTWHMEHSGLPPATFVDVLVRQAARVIDRGQGPADGGRRLTGVPARFLVGHPAGGGFGALPLQCHVRARYACWAVRFVLGAGAATSGRPLHPWQLALGIYLARLHPSSRPLTLLTAPADGPWLGTADLPADVRRVVSGLACLPPVSDVADEPLPPGAWCWAAPLWGNPYLPPPATAARPGLEHRHPALLACHGLRTLGDALEVAAALAAFAARWAPPAALEPPRAADPGDPAQAAWDDMVLALLEPSAVALPVLADWRRHDAVAAALQALLQEVPGAWLAAAWAVYRQPVADRAGPSPDEVVALLLPRLGWRVPGVDKPVFLGGLTVRLGTAMQLGDVATARLALHEEYVREAHGGPPGSPLPEGSVSRLRLTFPRLWKVRWENRHKEVLWRLAVDGIPLAGTAHVRGVPPEACGCGAYPRGGAGSGSPRLHHFWLCPVARAVVGVLEVHLAAAVAAPAPGGVNRAVAGRLRAVLRGSPATVGPAVPRPLSRVALWLVRAPPGCEQCLWDVVALAALSAVDRGRFTLRAASRRQGGSGSAVAPGLGPCAHAQVVAVADFWARLQGFAHLGVPRAGWGAVGPTHPFLRVVGGRLRCVV